MEPSVHKKVKMISDGTIKLGYDDRPTQSNLKLDLKQHQNRMVHAMMNIEQNKIKLDSIHIEIESSVGICGDDVGCGKSLSIIALISASTEIRRRNSYRTTNEFYNVMHIRETLPSNISLIVVPHSIIKQWSTYIESQSSLQYYVVSKFAHINHVNLLGDFDVILVSSSMYNSFIQRNRDAYFRRAVFDEADSIRIPACLPVYAEFTWLVTSSLENILFPMGCYYVPNRDYTNAYVRRTCVGFKRHGFLNNIIRSLTEASVPVLGQLVLKNKPEFAKRSLGILPPTRFYITCKTPLFLRIVQFDADNQLIELLNMGDVQGAIEHMGCKQETHETIVSAVTGNIRIKKQNTVLQIEYVRHYNGYSESERNTKLAELFSYHNRLDTRLISIENEIEHYQESNCPICWDGLSPPVATTSCCNKIFCFKCIGRCSKCPMCRFQLTENNIIVIDDHPVPIVETQEHKSKNQTVLDLIHKTQDGKFLLFSDSDYAFEQLVIDFNKANITFSRLSGNGGVIANSIARFNSGDTNVLLLNPKNYGCGLNLEKTTDIIFYHKFSADMERQTIGRAQRHGRDHTLRVHYLFYKNEYNT